MRWLVTLAASAQDVERLAKASLGRLSVDADDPGQLILELHDPEGSIADSEGRHAAKSAIDAVVRNLNGAGRLRWGRTFEGVSIQAVRSFDSNGAETKHVFVGAAVDHMLPEEFADLCERLGFPRPELPAGWDVIKALELDAVTELAASTPSVARVLHHVSLMLVGDDDIDWVSGYAALEIIEQDLRARGLKGPDLGWWTRADYKRFTATANSPEVLGYRARHGRDSGLTEARMTASDASWFVRRAVACWLTDLASG